MPRVRQAAKLPQSRALPYVLCATSCTPSRCPPTLRRVLAVRAMCAVSRIQASPPAQVLYRAIAAIYMDPSQVHLQERGGQGRKEDQVCDAQGRLDGQGNLKGTLREGLGVRNGGVKPDTAQFFGRLSLA